MHRMQVHPEQCLGCLVVAPADESSFSIILRFLESVEDHMQPENSRNINLLIKKDK